MRATPLALMVTALGLVGCGSSTPPVKVSGRVSWNGQPLTSGLVVFAPDSERGQRGILAMGTVNPDGTYELATEAGEGLAPGAYRVTVSEPVQLDRATLPTRFQHPDLSGLRAEVPAGHPAVTLDWPLAGEP